MGDADLSQVVLGDVDPRVVAGLADGRQQDADEQRDDRDDHQQLDDRKASLRASMHGERFLSAPTDRYAPPDRNEMWKCE